MKWNKNIRIVCFSYSKIYFFIFRYKHFWSHNVNINSAYCGPHYVIKQLQICLACLLVTSSCHVTGWEIHCHMSRNSGPLVTLVTTTGHCMNHVKTQCHVSACQCATCHADGRSSVNHQPSCKLQEVNINLSNSTLLQIKIVNWFQSSIKNGLNGLAFIVL